ncbi:MAG TPA: hypothetical protein VM307_07000, partial [Egibacteraceae bacterium]|nr:hypothetical protein [Egibacteraceae bacterium]
LGLSIGGATMTRVRRRMLELGLDDPRLLGNARSAAKAQILRLGLDTAHFGQVRFSKPVKISRSGAVARGTRRGWQRR